MSAKTRTFQLNKLVRDGIVEDIITGGGSVKWEKLEPGEFRRMLIMKLREELDELERASTRKDTISELGDILEAVEQLAANEGISMKEVKQAQTNKRDRLGGFAGAYFVHTVTLPEESEWVKYYASQPDLYPEIKE